MSCHAGQAVALGQDATYRVVPTGDREQKRETLPFVVPHAGGTIGAGSNPRCPPGDARDGRRMPTVLGTVYKKVRQRRVLQRWLTNSTVKPSDSSLCAVLLGSPALHLLGGQTVNVMAFPSLGIGVPPTRHMMPWLCV